MSEAAEKTEGNAEFVPVGVLLAEQARRYPDRTLLAFEDQKFTYAEFDARASRLASHLADCGVEKGSPVGVMIPNSPIYLLTWMAVAKLGAVLIGISTEHRGESLLHTINLSGATIIVVEPEYRSRVTGVASQLKNPPTLISSDELLTISEADLSTGAAPEFPDPPVDAADPLMVIFSSGTTGPAKAIEISQGYALHAVFEHIVHMRLTADDVLYAPYPLYHAEASNYFLTALRLGATMALARRFSASRFWDEIRHHGATVCTLIGAVLVILSKLDRRDDDAENPLRIAGVVPMPEAAAEFEARFGVQLLGSYGATECCVVVWDDPDSPRRAGSSGVPCEHHEIQIVDGDGQEVKQGSVGEIAVRDRRPLAQATGYWRDPAATAAAWKDGWYLTGDRARLDEDGWLYFVERASDSMRYRGRNVSAFEVEQVLNAHPGIQISAVVGVPSELSEEDIKAVVVPLDSQIGTDEIAAFASERLAGYMVPRYIERLGELPMTSTGKVNKALLRSDWQTARTFDCEREVFLDPEGSNYRGGKT